MKHRQKNRMESIALFEEKVPITPKDLSRGAIQIEKLLAQKLAVKLEGKCSLHGYVVPGSTKLISRSVGYVEKGRYTGDIVYQVQAEAKVIYPPDGTRLDCVVERKNKMGMYVNYKDAIHVILPRDLHIGEDERSIEFNDVQPREIVQIEIKKSRFQVNDPFILSVGLYLGRSGKTSFEAPEAVTQTEKLPMGRPVVERLDDRRDALLAIRETMAPLLAKGLTTDSLPFTRKGSTLLYTLAFDAPPEKLKTLDKEFEVLRFTPTGFLASTNEEIYERDLNKLQSLLSEMEPTAETSNNSEDSNEEEEDDE